VDCCAVVAEDDVRAGIPLGLGRLEEVVAADRDLVENCVGRAVGELRSDERGRILLSVAPDQLGEVQRTGQSLINVDPRLLLDLAVNGALPGRRSVSAEICPAKSMDP